MAAVAANHPEHQAQVALAALVKIIPPLLSTQDFLFHMAVLAGAAVALAATVEQQQGFLVEMVDCLAGAVLVAAEPKQPEMVQMARMVQSSSATLSAAARAATFS